MNPSEEKLIEHKKEAVKLYLEQVKILTAIATALFISPGFVIAFLNFETEANHSFQSSNLALIAGISSSMFLVAILLTYFIYSSLVGRINVGEYNLERKATMRLSIAQFICVIIGCVLYLIFICVLING